MLLLITIGGPPENARETFSLLQGHRLRGLLRLDLLTILIMPFYYVLFLALYAALRKTNDAAAILATVLAFAGVTLVLATPSAFSWIDLSDKFAAAADGAQRERLLAAGEAIFASDLWHGSGARIGGALLLIGALLISVAMLRTSNFGKATAYAGIATHGLDLARILIAVFSSTGAVAMMAIAGPLYLLWFPLLARDLYRLGKKQPGQS
jgi:hypothetical protein